MSRCAIRIPGSSDEKILACYRKAIEAIYEIMPDGKVFRFMGDHSIEISSWKGIPTIEIQGRGKDSRCRFCNYFVKLMEPDDIVKMHCPFHQ